MIGSEIVPMLDMIHGVSRKTVKTKAPKITI
jgi:hypothetical protein